MEHPEIKLLLDQYLAGVLTNEDFKRLWRTLQHCESNAAWLEAIEDAIYTQTKYGLSDKIKAAEALARIKERIIEEEQRQQHQPSIFSILNNKSTFLKYAAAILAIVFAAALYQFLSTRNDLQNQTVQTVTPQPDVEPGGQKAILTLADGSTIVLDNAGNGQIAQQGQISIIKLPNGQIKYNPVGKLVGAEAEMNYNTMSTPRGGQYQLILPDGSKVWLNAESSITYPVLFAQDERSVKISGEVYFEVTKDKQKPFRVKAGDMEVEVLGTQFNVNAYGDEGPVKTSLLEGSVKINKQILKPGEAYMNGAIVPTNIEQDVAWKNGIFNFNNQNLSQVMRQLARWYDLQIEYPEGIPDKEYGGEIGRNLKLKQVLEGLEQSGIHLQLAGKKVIVTPMKSE